MFLLSSRIIKKFDNKSAKSVINGFYNKNLKFSNNNFSLISIRNVFTLGIFEKKVPLAPLRYASCSPLKNIIKRLRSSSSSSCFLRHSVAVSVGRNNIAYRHYNIINSEFNNNLKVIINKRIMCDKKTFQRLPENIKPKHYDLNLVPDLKELIFKGDVSIEIEVKEPTQEIILNSSNLSFKKVDILGPNGSQKCEKYELDEEQEIAKLTFSNTILPEKYKLNIEFNGILNDKMKGFYRSKYTNVNGEESYAAVTQFEPTDARQCFPCWDEPALKATFNITVTVPKGRTTLSNMPVKSTSECGDFVTYAFDKTPIMSTYLVAVVVGEYDYIESKSSDGVLVRVYTPVGKSEQGRFALDVAVKVLPYYNYYFGLAYPLPKIDLIAISDFSAGAMENWGLVTYRETCLLVDPENTPAIRKQWVAIVVSHELAHQWFGNLVTMEWWTHLWLNEGYAQFTEFLCVDHLFPNYDIWKQFVSEVYSKAIELDALKSSHPIEVPVQHPSEIEEIFDDISYCKGASVIRMLHNYIGEDDFRKGMNLYLTRHQYKNTFTEDLWTALQEVSEKPVREVMKTWTEQVGFPELKVEMQEATNGVLLKFSQNRFSADGKNESDALWMIPISVSTSKNPGKVVTSTMLNEKNGELFIPDVDINNDWIKINPGTVGFYRVNYSKEMLKRLKPALKNQTLPPLDRLGIIDDVFALSQAGSINTVEVLDLLTSFENETDYTVWSTICGSLSKLSSLIQSTDYKEQFNAYQRKLLSNIFNRLGWDPKPNESHSDTLLRSLIMSRLVWIDYNEILPEARNRFDKHCSTQGPKISADLRSVVYKLILRSGDKKEFDTLIQLYRTADLHEEKDRISRSLGATKDPSRLNQVLNFAMSNEVRSQDAVFVLMSVSTTGEVGRDLTWSFYKENWQVLLKKYEGGSLISRLVKAITENFGNDKMRHEVQDFFNKNKVPGTERSIQQALESIKLNALWYERNENDVREYLKLYS